MVQTIAALVLIALVVFLTGLLAYLVAETGTLSGAGRSGASMQLGFVLPLRWLCLAGLLAICVAKGAIPWPATAAGQYVVVLTVHAVLGFVSLMIAGMELEGGGIKILRWVPFVLPAAQIALAISTLFPQMPGASGLRAGALGVLAVAGGGAGLFVGVTGIAACFSDSGVPNTIQAYEEHEKRWREEGELKALNEFSPDEPLEVLFRFTDPDSAESVRAKALALIERRPALGGELLKAIASEDHEAARLAMTFAGTLTPLPTEVADAIRERAREVVRIAESIDPAADDSGYQLHERAQLIAEGVIAAAPRLRRAGVDLRPELRAIAQASASREKEEPRTIAGACEQLLRDFDRLDRETP